MLARALRAAIGLRDKVVVVRLDAATLADPTGIEATAADLALGRALGVRMIAICEGRAPKPPGPALRLAAALERHGAMGVALPAEGIVTVHAGMPVVNAMVLVQLCSLGYVPVLYPPVADAAGVVVDLAPEALAAAVARFTDAARVISTDAPGQLLADVLLHDPAAPAGPR